MIPDRRSPDVFADVRKFIELAQPDHITKLGSNPKVETLKLLKHIIEEEVNKELMPNLDKMIEKGANFELITQFLDDALDSIYVIAWGIAAMSLPGQAGWNEIQKANMSKFPLENPDYPDIKPLLLDLPEYLNILPTYKKVDKRWILTNPTTGKVMKPAGFQKPNIFDVIHGMITIEKILTIPDVIATSFMNEYFHEMEKRREEDESNA
jgi:hypothetical protein